MLQIKAPEAYDHVKRPYLFLAGTIDMGGSKDWQRKVATALDDMTGGILNPRRDDWDSSWKQSITDDTFREQVTWELGAMEAADVIAMNIEDGSKSPITLLEYGLWARSGKLLLCCSPGFYRYGNLDIVAARYGVSIYNDKTDWIRAIRRALSCRAAPQEFRIG